MEGFFEPGKEITELKKGDNSDEKIESFYTDLLKNNAKLAELEEKQDQRFKDINKLLNKEDLLLKDLEGLKGVKSQRIKIIQDTINSIRKKIIEERKVLINSENYLKKINNIIKKLKLIQYEKKFITIPLNAFIERLNNFKRAFSKLERLEKDKLKDLKFILLGEEKTLIKAKEGTKDSELLKELQRQRKIGTVASIAGFLGITSSSIIARIIGNSVANSISPGHKSSSKIIIGDKRKDKQDIIDLILKKKSEDTEKLENDIDHLEKRLEQDEEKRDIENIKKCHKNKASQKINLINVINRI